ncbi:MULTISPECIES: dihydrolipoyl dehydrogenase [unclassified Fusibacter]|uniref:dihydrolipoyl dehydrogenase n=1 Tax=unclassified Fusibacter TaxID=2624464 RepID=UPI001010A581|nr:MULTISPECIES: dihydrolipoyl dehydrogenase [unclassified Fusibacter]MCK8061305.1 dihydrolipoyl dehydrogenase [Fusibacter sp. A2]NPE23498.1 dihydrolipoyl dehydrogenase [Fusibacter sp. A1]RXV59104.1 dihydrolipoyl dehydrogenase [Fusibacter sp. A1]
MKTYDIAIIGGGPGGYVAAIKAAQLGYDTVLFEAHKIGGICLNYGCIPTKTLLKTAKLFKEIKHAKIFGIDIDGVESARINWDHMMLRKDKVVKQLTGGVSSLLKHNGVTVISGFANVTDNHTLEVDGDRYGFKQLIVATGSSPVMPSIPGLEEAVNKGYVIDSTGAIALKSLPKKLVILGGGVIAVEFATLYSNLGTEVVLIQRSSEILSFLDKDVKSTMHKHLVKSGVKIITETKIKEIRGNQVIFTKNGEDHRETGDFILASLGRKPNLRGLEALNLEHDKKGILVDERMRTNIDNVYAIGDVNGKYMLAHVASAEGISAVEAIHGEGHPVDYNKIPSCIYSFPEVGVVGLTEDQAIEKGYDVTTSIFPVSVNGKALAEGESVGFVKLIADKKYGEVIGVHIIASHATDMIAEAVATMELEGTIHDLAKAVHPHPTLSELVMEAAHSALGNPIHMKK